LPSTITQLAETAYKVEKNATQQNQTLR